MDKLADPWLGRDLFRNILALFQGDFLTLLYLSQVCHQWREWIYQWDSSWQARVYIIVNFMKYRDGMSIANAINQNDQDMVKWILSYEWWDWNWMLELAAGRGHRHLIDYFIEQGADDWDQAMAGAAGGNQRDLVVFFIEQGANDWNRAMIRAVRNGHRDLVYFFISMGANEWRKALRMAKRKRHPDLVALFQQCIKAACPKRRRKRI